jgi:hypothetical protein
MAHISAALRHEVTERARGRCEYCQTQQEIVVSMEIDHIVPEAAGGETISENLCLACIGCNGFKLDFQSGIDPDTSQEAPLFNPRTQTWTDHFQWSDDGLRLIGLTTTGRATITRLQMNRDAVVNSRRRWVEVGWHPPHDEK